MKQTGTGLGFLKSPFHFRKAYCILFNLPLFGVTLEKKMNCGLSSCLIFHCSAKPRRKKWIVDYPHQCSLLPKSKTSPNRIPDNQIYLKASGTNWANSTNRTDSTTPNKPNHQIGKVGIQCWLMTSLPSGDAVHDGFLKWGPSQRTDFPQKDMLGSLGPIGTLQMASISQLNEQQAIVHPACDC